STTPVITAGLALLVQGRREAPVTYAALLPVVGGIALASGGEPLFNAWGLLLQMTSCTSRSLKTVLQAMLLTDEQDRFHPITLLCYTSALSALLLLPLVAVAEPRALRHVAQLYGSSPAFLPLLLFSCAVAFLVNWTNFLVSKQLGALTLQVLGNFKNVVAAAVSVAVFGNPVTGLGLAGYAVTTAGVMGYSYLVAAHPAASVAPPLGFLAGLSGGPAATGPGEEAVAALEAKGGQGEEGGREEAKGGNSGEGQGDGGREGALRERGLFTKLMAHPGLLAKLQQPRVMMVIGGAV
ncbi:putative sugar phosphate/phosphate translocator, partial [Tetrabaena socialis]